MKRFVVKSKENDDGDTVIVFIPDPFGDWCMAEDVQELVTLTNELLCHAHHRENCTFVLSHPTMAYSVGCSCGLGSILMRLESTNENFFDE